MPPVFSLFHFHASYRPSWELDTFSLFFSLEHCPSILGIFHYLHVQQVEKRAPFYDLQKHSNLWSLKVVTPCFRVYTIFEDLHGSGHFRTEMQLFIGNSPIPKNFSVSASDDILIEVGIQRADSKLKVVLTDCWATPTNNSVDPLSFTFINNRYSKRHLQISCALRWMVLTTDVLYFKCLLWVFSSFIYTVPDHFDWPHLLWTRKVGTKRKCFQSGMW